VPKALRSLQTKEYGVHWAMNVTTGINRDRRLLEDRLIEQITLEQLSSEQRCDPRTIGKRVQRAIERLRSAESDLP
jgi:hypothetical protein